MLRDNYGRQVSSGFYIAPSDNRRSGVVVFLRLIGVGRIEVQSWNPSSKRVLEPDEADKYIERLVRVDNPRETASFILSDRERLEAHDGV